MFRDSARAYATDALARERARRAIERGHDLVLDGDRRTFLYMPFMHSETLADQAFCVALGETRVGSGDFLDYARRHRDVVARFGRFPHRNAVLGRANTGDEDAFLAENEAGF